MPSKLALVAVITPHEGPWQRADGSEKSVEVIGTACDVALEHVGLDSQSLFTVLQAASMQPFPAGTCSYRAVRRDTGTTPVSVRIHFN